MAQLMLIESELLEYINKNQLKTIFIYIDNTSSITIRATTLSDEDILLFTTKGMVKIFRSLNAAFNNIRKLVKTRPLKVELRYDSHAMLPIG